MSKVKLTNSSDEADLSSVFGNNAIFSIPFFQRPYKWQPKQVNQLAADILSLVDEQTDVHFLGAVIIHGLPNNPADSKVFEVIDGQQRLTTLYLFICAIVRALIESDEHEEATSIFLRYLVTNIPSKGKSNLKLHPCKEDQADLNAVIYELINLKSFGKELVGFKFDPLPATSEGTGRISKNFLLIKKFIKEQLRDGGIERIRQINKDLLQRISVVQIDVQDPTNGPKIFDALNSRQEPMTVGDLVRNEVFAKVALEDPEAAANVDSHEWQPFYKRFKTEKKNYFDDYFFPFGLTRNANLRKSDVYSSLREEWKAMDPSEIIEDLARFQDEFLDLVTGSNECNLPGEVVDGLDRIRQLGAPSSTYPFLMQLIHACKKQWISSTATREILDVLDTFLSRRAICGHEPTGLHAVFKRLWMDVDGDYTAERVSSEIAGHKTVAWPSTGEVRLAVENRPLYGTSIAPYFIKQYDQSLGGDTTSDVPWVEHVLPTSPSASWTEFTGAEHSQMKDLAANLIPLSSSMNASLGNKSYAVKRAIYDKDSMFKSAREFAKSYDEWSPKYLKNRAAQLGDWAVARWPHDRPSPTDI